MCMNGADAVSGGRDPVDSRGWPGREPRSDAFDASKRHAPVMFTTDLKLREDPSYGEISGRFLDNPEELRMPLRCSS